MLLISPAGAAAAEARRIGGLLPADENVAARWPWTTAWVWPVGAESEPGCPSSPDEPPWQVLRGFHDVADSVERHRGVDLGDGRAGDLVRASAPGLVIAVREGAAERGFGCHVVLAHRLRRGGLAYSVYSHVLAGTIRVREGECVWTGQELARVGRSGNASTDHLHFEIRLADDSEVRWERTRAVDPLAFLPRRLPDGPADSTLAGPYLEWAERGGLLESGADADDPLSRERWQQMLAAAARLPLLDLPRDPESLRDVLIQHGLLPARTHTPLAQAPTWAEMLRDLERLDRLGTRLPPLPPDGGPLAAACLSRLGSEHPTRDAARVQRATPPTVGDACLLLAVRAPVRRPAAGRGEPR